MTATASTNAAHYASATEAAPPSAERSGWPAVVWLVVGMAFLLRVASVIALAKWHDPTWMEHRSIALALLRGEGFSFGDWGYFGPSSVQSPPYPFLLTALYWLWGVTLQVEPRHDFAEAAAHGSAMFINAIAGAFACGATYSLCKILRATHGVALIAAILLAVWPTQLYATAYVQAITLITLGTVAIVYFWHRSLDTGRLSYWLAFSLIGCLAALTEPVLLPAMALSGLLIFIWPAAGLTFAARFRNAAILLASAIVVIGPWTMRNIAVHGSFVPIKSTFWVNVWKGNNPHASGTDRPVLTPELLAQFERTGRDEIRQYDLLSVEHRAELMGKTDVEREAIFARISKEWIAENPGGYARLCAIRFAKTMWGEWDNPKGRTNLVYLASRSVLLLGTLIGLPLALRRRWRLGYAGIVVGFCLLTYTLTITAARFAFPLEPFQMGLTALAGVWLWQRFGPGAKNIESA